MAIRVFVVIMSLLIYGGLYALYEQQTFGSMCRNVGSDIAYYGSTVQLLGTIGRAINDTCSGR